MLILFSSHIRKNAGRVGVYFAQPFRERFETQKARWVREHGLRTGLGKPLPLQQFEEDLAIAPPHVGVGFAFGRRITEVAPALDHLLRRATANAELEPAACD